MISRLDWSMTITIWESILTYKKRAPLVRTKRAQIVCRRHLNLTYFNSNTTQITTKIPTLLSIFTKRGLISRIKLKINPLTSLHPMSLNFHLQSTARAKATMTIIEITINTQTHLT